MCLWVLVVTTVVEMGHSIYCRSSINVRQLKSDKTKCAYLTQTGGDDSFFTDPRVADMHHLCTLRLWGNPGIHELPLG